MGKVFVDLGIDLLRRKNEDGGDALECLYLLNECSVVDKAQVAVEDEKVHQFNDCLVFLSDLNFNFLFASDIVSSQK